MITNRDIRNCEEEVISVLNKYDFPFELKRIMLTNLALKCEHEADKAILTETIEEKGELDNAESVC